MDENYLANITYNEENTSYIISNKTNSSEEYDYHTEEQLYKYYVPLLILFCLASLIINFKVLLAIHWLRRPISPTLQISLSLAAADALSSVFVGIGLFFNSYIQQVLVIEIPCYIRITTEMYRLSAIIITVVHLLALSINHWLGIMKPLHYSSIMTSRKTILTVFFLWIVPIVFFNIYFFTVSEEGFWINGCYKITFINRFRFRITFSLLFFIPLILMIFFYTHILYIVKKQTKVWTKLSRSGSKRTKSLSKSNSQQRRTMEGNVKAVFTTLLILGSCLVGWMPNVMRFLLVCSECIYTPEDTKNIDSSVEFLISWMTYFLMILKTLLNPIIYSTRMIEIKEATRRMNLAIKKKFCGTNKREDNLFESQSYQIGCTRITYKLNGSSNHRNTRKSQPNTLV